MADRRLFILNRGLVLAGLTFFKQGVTFGTRLVDILRVFPLAERLKHGNARIINFHGQSERHIGIHTNQL